MKKLLLSVCCLMLSMHLFAQSNDVWEIRKMLFAQVTQWNKGNMDGYLKGYWENDSLLFIGSAGPRYGYTATLKRYKEAYPDAEHMGTLTSRITNIQKLSDNYYFVVGTWAVQRALGNSNGSYTLLLRKIKGKWTIICDHSS